MEILYKQVIEAVVNDSNVKRAVKYISPKMIARATRTGKKAVRSGNIEITLTIGKPNYLEREFIKLCNKAKEPYPIKIVQLKMFPIIKSKRINK